MRTQFPAYYRVKNDLMSLSGDYLVEESTAMSHKLSVKKRGSPFRSTQRSHEGAKGSPPPNSLHYVVSSKTVNIMDSLNIDPPKSSSSQVSPLLPKKGYLNFKRAGSTKSRFKDLIAYEEELDYGDKRASIRSDPGDRKRETSGLFNRSPKISATSTPIRKSAGVTSRVSSLEDSDSSPSGLGKEGFVFNFNEDSPGYSGGSSGSPRSPVRVRKAAVAITKKEISQPSDVKHCIVNLPEEVAIKSHFTLKYSGGDGEKAGYQRCMESSIKVKVRPSLYFTEFRISKAEG